MAKLEPEIIAQAARRGVALPDNIVNAPEVPVGFELYWRAFWDLVGERYDLTAPIRWTACQQWADTYHLTRVQSEELHKCVREMDVAYCAHMRKRIIDERAKAANDKRQGAKVRK
jgi:hypothetical protein